LKSVDISNEKEASEQNKLHTYFKWFYCNFYRPFLRTNEKYKVYLRNSLNQ